MRIRGVALTISRNGSGPEPCVTDMRHHTLLYTLLCALPCLGFTLPSQAASQPATAEYARDGHQGWGMLKQYCSKCHNAVDWAGGVAFDTMNPQQVPANAKVWEAAVRKLSGRLMPPPGNPQPPQKQIDKFVGWLRGYLDAADAAGDDPRAGHVSIQRLNRTQYGDSVQALLGVKVNVDDLLPVDTEVGGFDNIAAALGMSPTFLDEYIRAARVVAHLAVGEPAPKVAVTIVPATGTDPNPYHDGVPLGSRGGMAFNHDFPLDGLYKFTIQDLGVGLYTGAMETRSTVLLLVDNKVVFRGDLGGLKDLELADREGATGRAEIMARFANIPVHVTAGQHKVVVTFIERSEAESDEEVGGGFSFRGGGARLGGGVQIAGPYGPTELSMTPSRRRIFICEPQASSEERPCAQKIASHLAQLAFRRPTTQDDLDALMPFYDHGAKKGGFNEGVEYIVAAILASPDFLYRTIVPTTNADDGKLHELTDLELASRLSFFLWDQGPDQELLDLAIAGKLSQPKVLDAEARRMLADPRAESLVTDFAFHWLDIDKMSSVVPDRQLFPTYTPQLGEDFTTEVKLFIGSILLDNQSVVGLLNARYTFLNERLARHYDIDNVYGTQFRRVELDDPVRWGLLGKAAVLMETSYANRTSPVRRGAWVLDKLMGTPPAQPPPNVNMNLDIMPGHKPTTVRARLALHRATPFCSQCHGVIDPYGLALENFDATGAWRTYDHIANEPIDAASVLPSGVPVRSVNDVRRILANNPGQFVDAMTDKLMMYALGRTLDYYDMPQVRAIARAAKKDDYRFDTIVLGIVNSDDFRMQAEPSAAGATGLKVAANVGATGAPDR